MTGGPGAIVWHMALSMVTLIVAGSAWGCSGRESTDEPTPAESTTLQASDTDASIFELDLPLIDQAGHPAKLADLGGEVTLAAMVYTSCTAVCPRITEEMLEIERQLAGAGEEVRFVLFSLDPGRDSPAARRQFARDHRLGERWRILATSEEGVRDLAAVLGVKYRPEADGEIAHSAMIVLIDREGVVRHRQVGLGQNPATLVAAVRKARG
jgi:protein SCO1/2